MLNVIEGYNSVLDRINSDENGQLSIAKFNRFSKLGELRLLDWLSGDVSGAQPPAPYLTQKNKDWIQNLIKKYPAHVTGGIITLPTDYYTWENLYKLGSSESSDCEEDVIGQTCNTPIEILDGDEYNERCRTHIEELKPKNKPIAKVIGNTIEFNPSDIGSVTLEYFRYPVFGKIIPMKDMTFNDEVPNPALSINYEWPEFALEPLVWFIADEFYNSTREQLAKQMNTITGKTVRDGK